MRSFVSAAIITLVSACGPTPVGDWTGTVDFMTTDGQTYNNTIHADKDKSAAITLYALVDNPDYPDNSSDEYLLVYVDLDGTWSVSKDVATFDVSASTNGATLDETIDCTFEDPGLLCDATPDIYQDDASSLQFTEDDT